MTKLQRAEAKFVPENWREEYYNFDKEYQKWADRAAVDNFLLQRPIIKPKRDEVLSFFETCISVPDVSGAYLRRIQAETVEDVSHLDVLIIIHFLRWWLSKYTDYSIADIGMWPLHLTISLMTNSAIVHHAQGGDIAECYDMMSKAMPKDKISE